MKFEIAVEEGNAGTDSPNLQHPQDGDPEVGDPEAGEPETGYHEYNEVTKGPGFDNYGSVDLYWHYSRARGGLSPFFQTKTISSWAWLKLGNFCFKL